MSRMLEKMADTVFRVEEIDYFETVSDPTANHRDFLYKATKKFRITGKTGVAMMGAREMLELATEMRDMAQYVLYQERLEEQRMYPLAAARIEKQDGITRIKDEPPLPDNWGEL